MNDVQFALLTLGFIVIIIMIIHNWAQLKKHQKKNTKANNLFSPNIR